MKTNRQIRANPVRVIGSDGNQVGVISLKEALEMAQEEGLDLIEVVPNSEPPVCKIIDYGKFRYDQTKREKESKKVQVQVKVKEVKVKPNIDTNDLNFKIKRARDFLAKGYKVRITCMFRGREMAYPERGRKVIDHILVALDDCSTSSGPPKFLGRNLSMVISPSASKKKIVVPQAPSEKSKG